jgi:hypothetical protein
MVTSLRPGTSSSRAATLCSRSGQLSSPRDARSKARTPISQPENSALPVHSPGDPPENFGALGADRADVLAYYQWLYP